jgi:hypothetical protein
MPRFFDRVKETTTTTGTGDVTLAGAVTQFRAFSSVFSVGDEQIPYAVVGQTGGEWEVGYGTYSASNTLRRDAVIASSNANAFVNFSSGTKDVFVTISAQDATIEGRVIAMSRGYAMP